jgi:hypothetical protein
MKNIIKPQIQNNHLNKPNHFKKNCTFWPNNNINKNNIKKCEVCLNDNHTTEFCYFKNKKTLQIKVIKCNVQSVLEIPTCYVRAVIGIGEKVKRFLWAAIGRRSFIHAKLNDIDVPIIIDTQWRSQGGGG